MKSPDLLDGGNADITEGRIVPHDVNQVGWPAVLFPQLRQFLVEFTILGGPFFAVLGFEDVVLGIMNDLIAFLCRRCPGTN